MKTTRLFLSHLAASLALLFVLTTTNTEGAQIVTNWVAYNDNVPNYPPVNGWFTAPRVTGYDMGETGASGNLTNFLDGQQLPVVMTSFHTGATHGFGLAVEPNDNTPVARLFKGIVDVSNPPNNQPAGSLIGVQFNNGGAPDYATITFSGLDPNKHYVFRGTGVRGGPYALRWSVATIIGAQTFVDAHVNGNGGPGVLTANNFPADLVAGQAAWNGGDNREGAIIGWDFITPAPDGTFSVQSSNYVGHITPTSFAANNTYSYAINAMLLAEVEVAAPVITGNPPAQTTIEQNRPLSLSVAASGTPLFYQWYKQGSGALSGATFATYSVAQAALSDSGDYYVQVYNPLGSVTSTVAHVTVNADITGPGIATVFSYPNVDFATLTPHLNQVIIEFNEVVQGAGATDPSHYLISGGVGNPTSVVLTNERTVALMLSSDLTEDTAYTVQVSGIVDLVNNNISNGGTNNPAPFRTWVSGSGNGLSFESFTGIPGGDVPDLTNNPAYPDNPSLRANLGIFDSRAVYDSASTVDNYGARVRGVFIPPVSGNWVFLVRSIDISQVYFNPNGLDPAGKQAMTGEAHADTDGNWGRIQSGAVSLKAGQGYYIEALYKTDAATGFLKMAALLQGSPLPPAVANTELDTNAIMGATVAFPLAPRDLGGVLSIAQDVGDVTAEDNHDVTFSVVVNNPSGLPLFYQWSREGSGPIPGANGPTYTFQASLATDNNAMFSVTVSKVGAQVTSRTARLSVVPDVSGPHVLEVSSPGFTNIIVRFDERVESFSAQDPFAYVLVGPGGPISIDGAVLGADEKTVTLDPGEDLVSGNTYELTVKDVTDLGLLPMVPNPTVVNFTAGVSLPQLAIARSGNEVVLSWPVSAAGFVLEQTSALAEPASATVWNAVGVTPVVVAGRNTVTVAAGPGTKAFRLRR